MVKLQDETALASDLLADVKHDYPGGIHELKISALYDSMTLRLDTVLEAEFIFFSGSKQLTLEVMNSNSTLRRSSDGVGGEFGYTTQVQVLFNPTEPLTGDIDWLVFEAPLRAQTIDYRNQSPFTLVCNVEGLKNRGVVYSAADVLPGEVGLLIDGILDGSKQSCVKSVRIIARPLVQQLPEPTTATLSLLALATLIARRRRK